MSEMVDIDAFVLDPNSGRELGYLTGMRSLVEGIGLVGRPAIYPRYVRVSDNGLRIGGDYYRVHGVNRSATPGARRLQLTRHSTRVLIAQLIRLGFTVAVQPTRRNDLLPAGRLAPLSSQERTA